MDYQEDIVIAPSTKTANYFPHTEAQKFLSLLPVNSSILDVGCGIGRDARIFAELGYKVVGIDMSEKLLTIAKKENPDLELNYMDMKATTFPDDFFDGIWANAALHYLGEEEMIVAIKEWGRICKPSGIVYVSTRLGLGTRTTIEQMVNEEKKVFTLISEEQLHTYCRAAGFEQISIYSYNEKERFPDGTDTMWIAGFFRKASFS